MSTEGYHAFVASDRSPLADAVARVGDRWSLLIVDALMRGSLRFSELEGRIEGIASNILSQRLKHLESEGVLIARAYSERPPRFDYKLTAAGQELAGALRLLADWGARGSDGEAGPRHEACGTRLEPHWLCPTCGVVVGDRESAELHHA